MPAVARHGVNRHVRDLVAVCDVEHPEMGDGLNRRIGQVPAIPNAEECEAPLSEGFYRSICEVGTAPDVKLCEVRALLCNGLYRSIREILTPMRGELHEVVVAISCDGHYRSRV